MTNTRLLEATATALALAALAPRAAAQDVAIGLSWGRPGVRATAYYASPGLRLVAPDGYYYEAPRRRIVHRHFDECVADGPYLYCWDAPRTYYAVRPVVYVYATDPVVAHRHHRGKRGRGPAFINHHRAVAYRVWRHWADDHRYRYDRSRLFVDVAFAW
jgi:hypothetical protein